MKKQKNRRVEIAVFSAVFLLAGCAGDEERPSGYRDIVDDYAEILLNQDADSAGYDEALLAVGAYLENPGEDELLEAETAVKDAISRLEEAEESFEPKTLDGNFSKLLKEYGIEPEEYMMMADERAEYLYDYVSSLKAFEEYLSYEKEDDLTRDALKAAYEMASKEQEVWRAYHYCGINYWFAGWEEEETDYVRQKAHDNLQSFSAEQEAWQDDRDAVEQRMTFYLNQMEELMQERADDLGERQEELYQMEGETEE